MVGVNHVPPTQYAKLKRKFPLMNSHEIRTKWARIQKAKKGANLKLKHQLIKPQIVTPNTYPEPTKVLHSHILPSQDFQNPVPSTSTWPLATMPQKLNDYQKLESPLSQDPLGQDQRVGDRYEVEGSDTSDS